MTTMKKFGMLLIVALTAVLGTGCDDTDGDYARYAAFVTVETLPGNDYYFRLDNDETAYPSDKSLVAGYRPEENGRALIYFDYDRRKKPEAEYDYNFKLYGIDDILTGDTRTVTTEEEAKALPDNKTSYSGANLNGNYLNVGVGFYVTDYDLHSFTLVRNDFEAPDAEHTQEEYLNLELRHDAHGDTEGLHHWTYVSFPMDEFREALAEKRGIILRVSTYANGVQYLRVDKGR